MLESDFNDRLMADGGRLCPPGSAIGGFSDFGDRDAETAELNTGGVVIPLPGLIRIRVTGRDRAKFLHNFCTNNIQSLADGGWCEAFFTDVKAHVLGHGFVLAVGDALELWMLAGEETQLLNHLQKYVITEDVQIASATAESTAFAVIGPPAAQIEAEPPVLKTRWDDVPVTLIVVAGDQAPGTWDRLRSAGLRPAGLQAFDHLRIREQFPLVGTDLSHEHLAPEADRNQSAISYTKGCYLGQEPIARLDSMGHLNRCVKRVEAAADPEQIIGATVVTGAGSEIGTLTSVAPGTSSGQSIGLGVLRVKGLEPGASVVLRNRDGAEIPAEVR